MEHFVKREAYQNFDMTNKTVIKWNKWCHNCRELSDSVLVHVKWRQMGWERNF